jgi:hypothetical protein
MELLKEKIKQIINSLSFTSKGLLLISSISSAFGFIFYQLFIKKKNRRYLKNEDQRNKNTLNFVSTKLKWGGFNFYGRNYLDIDRVEIKRRNLYEMSYATFKKLQHQRNLMPKTDQVFVNLMQKFTVFALKHKFA